MQPVKVALAEGQVTILDSGLKPGQKVVVDGADRLRAGQPVTVSAARQQSRRQAGRAQQPAAFGQARRSSQATGGTASARRTQQ